MITKVFWLIGTFFLRIRIRKIGLSSYVGRPLLILGGRHIFIGNKVRIFPGSRMETHRGGEIILENNISIGQNLHLISSNEPLVISADTTISGNVFITNIDHDYQQLNVHILDQPYIIKTTRIGKNCFIGYGAAIQAGTILGKHCVVGANSVVKGIFPDFCVIAGIPAKIVKRYNTDTGQWEKTNANGDFN